MSVDIDSPLSGSTVGRRFVAAGTASGAPTVTLDSPGKPTASGAVSYTNPNWTAAFNLADDYPDATLTATVGNDEATESNLTAARPPIRTFGMSTAPGIAKVGDAAGPGTVVVDGDVGPGTGNAAVATVVVTVFGLKAGVATFLGSSGVPVTPGTTWSVSLLVPALPAPGDRILARVQALNGRGRVIGSAGRRKKI